MSDARTPEEIDAEVEHATTPLPLRYVTPHRACDACEALLYYPIIIADAKWYHRLCGKKELNYDWLK